MEGLLAKIVKNKIEELKVDRHNLPLKEIKARLRDLEPTRNFLDAISPGKERHIRLIAEIKKRSPIKGLLIEDFKVDDLARRYEDAGASAISVITERRFFSGESGYINTAKEVVKLPILRKDFIIDEYQIYESRHIGADALLLIVSILDPSAISDYIALSSDLGMSCLVEIHSERELEEALKGGVEIIGINNRDLTTFEVDIKTTFRIMKEVPQGKIVVSESGINSRDDVKRLADVGVHAILVGESIVTAKDMGEKIRELLGYG